jgi:hypothetical protein
MTGPFGEKIMIHKLMQILYLEQDFLLTKIKKEKFIFLAGILRSYTG